MPPESLTGLAHATHTNARRIEQELGKGDLLMAEGHAILLEQQAAELRQRITDQRASEEFPHDGPI